LPAPVSPSFAVGLTAVAAVVAKAADLEEPSGAAAAAVVE
jgi:hypothetical protein